MKAERPAQAWRRSWLDVSVPAQYRQELNSTAAALSREVLKNMETDAGDSSLPSRPRSWLRTAS